MSEIAEQLPLEPVEVVEAPVTPPVDSGSPKSDEVQNDVRDAIAQLKGDKAAPGETEEQRVERKSRNPYREEGTGKFTSKPKEAAPEKAAPEIPAQDPDPKATPALSPAAGTPPGRWAADAKAIWPTLPPLAQREVLKAEEAINETGRRWSEEKRHYEQILAPLAQTASSRGMAPDQALQRLRDGDRFISQEPVEAIKWIAQNYGVDLSQFNGTPVESAPRTPRVDLSPVINRLSALEQHITTSQASQANSLVESFASKNPYFDEVSTDLEREIRFLKLNEPHLDHGTMLEKAYERALWVNPQVREKLQAEKLAATAKEKAEANAKKVAQSRQAAVSIKGSPNADAPNPKLNGNGKDDVYSDVRDAIHQLRSAV